MSDRSGRKQASAEAWSDCARCGMADANCWAQISASNAECCSACSHSLTPSVQATGPLRPRFHVGPLPGGASADGPAGLRQEPPRAPHVHGGPLHAEALGDLGDAVARRQGGDMTAPLPPGHVIHRLPADAKCGCTPACRHAFHGDMGGLDSDYDHCEACGDHWPCQHAKGRATPVCDLTACRICTGCAHGHPDRCRLTIRCPGTGETHPCRHAPKETR